VKREAGGNKLWVVESDEWGGRRRGRRAELRRKEVINWGEVEGVIGGVNCGESDSAQPQLPPSTPYGGGDSGFSFIRCCLD
jgi:hypothetical protein